MPKKPNFTAKLKLETGTHSALINQLRASPDGKTLASSSIDKTIRLWDVPAQKQTGMLLGQMGAGNEGAIQAFTFSRDGKYIVSLAWMYPDDRQDQNERETELRVYELATGNLQAGFRYPFKPDSAIQARFKTWTSAWMANTWLWLATRTNPAGDS
ncbi:MAG: hypothetical protein EDM79_05625 [Chloroflexi bacterium]|nr:MAG: hypothetical protein EDM79_05625 [Chloroflexota bacterium]